MRSYTGQKGRQINELKGRTFETLNYLEANMKKVLKIVNSVSSSIYYISGTIFFLAVVYFLRKFVNSWGW